MSEHSLLLSLPYIQQSQAQKHVTHNEAVRDLDVLVQLAVLDRHLATPPATPSQGDRYIVGPDPTGAWAGHENDIALWDQNAWQFRSAQQGFYAHCLSENTLLGFNGTQWSEFDSGLDVGDLQNLPALGIGTTASTPNALSVSSAATLLSHDGADHQLKINKAADANTASLMFQSDWTGHAEMGLMGGTDFKVKVSPDGQAFKEALTVDNATAAVQFPAGQNYFLDVFIRNDTSYSIDIPWSNPARILMWMGINIIGHYFLFSITGTMTGAGNFAKMFENPAGKLNFFTGPLSGTTGPAGSINMSIDTTTGTPKLHIENRIGTNRLFTLATLGK